MLIELGFLHNFMIKDIKDSDLAQVANIHYSALPNDLLPFLGRGFLINGFYDVCIKPGRTLFLGFFEQDVPCAFVIFAYDSKRLTLESSIYRLRFYLALVKILLSRPLFIKRLYSTFRVKRTMYEKQLKIEEYPELYLIAADPAYQNKGYGGKILSEGLKRLQMQNYKGCSVKTSSEKAKRFYEKNGFRVVGIEYRGLRKLYILFHNLSYLRNT